MPARRKKISLPTAEEIVSVIIEKGNLDRLHAYLSRGRRYSGLSNARLQNEYLTAMHEWAEDITVPSTYLKANDFGSEYEVRGIEPPFKLAKQDWEVALAAIGKLCDEMSEERREEINDELFADYERAIAEAH